MIDAEDERATDVLDTPEAGGLVVRGGMIRVASFVAGTILSLAGVVLITRHLGVSRYGRYQTGLSLVTVVSSVTDLGMATLGMREYAQRAGPERDHLIRVLLGLRLFLTTVGIAFAALIAAAGGYGWQLVAGCGLAGAGVLVIVVQTTLQIPLLTELRLGTVSALDVARQALNAALIAALALAGAGLVPFFATTIPVHLLLLAWTAFLVRGRIPVRPTFAWREWLALIRPTIAFALATAVGVTYAYTAQVITSLVTSAEQTGLFSAAFRVFVIVVAVPGILVSGAFPLLSRAARDDHARLANVLRGLFSGTLLLGGAAGIGVVIAAHPIIEVIAGPKYAGAVPVLRVQGVAILLSFGIATWGFTLLALHRHRAMVVANSAAFLASALTTALLGAAHGARGAAFGNLVGETVLAVGYFIAIRRVDRAFQPPVGRLLRILVALGAGFATGALCGLPALAATALALFVYGAVALLVGAVPDDVLAQFQARRAT